MNSFLLGLFRFILCAWLGAATLFVVTGIREVTSDIPITIKNALTTIRFPAFYLFGFVMTGLATLSAAVLARAKAHPKAKSMFVLLAIVVAIMVIDYIFIYTPLADLMSLPNARETDDFEMYHNWSKYVNFFELALCLVAAIRALGSNQSQS